MSLISNKSVSPPQLVYSNFIEFVHIGKNDYL